MPDSILNSLNISPEGPASLIDKIGLAGPDFSDLTAPSDEKQPTTADEVFATGKRRKWNAGATDEARCDFTANRHGIFFIKDFLYHAVWRKSIYGPTLKEIKSMPEMTEKFASEVAAMITAAIGDNLDPENFAVITAPKRRHKTHNFASVTAALIAKKIGLQFFEDVCFCHSKMRVNAVFTPADTLPPQRNLIVFDDIVTTGSTLTSIHRLFAQMGYSLSFFVGIKNS